MQRLKPYRVLPLDAGASADGLVTGYFEPQIDASRRPRGALRVPLYAPPADLATRKPWFTRAQIDSLGRRAGRACAAARSPTWPTRSTLCCCRCRARAGCA